MLLCNAFIASVAQKHSISIVRAVTSAAVEVEQDSSSRYMDKTDFTPAPKLMQMIDEGLLHSSCCARGACRRTPPGATESPQFQCKVAFTTRLGHARCLASAGIPVN